MPYATPSYGGFSIFGLAPRFVAEPAPLEIQETAYPGVNGVETLMLGGRGGVITVTGLIYGVNAAAVTTWELLFHSYRDGVARALVDTSGYSWTYAQLRDFRPTSKRYTTLYYGSIRSYAATFRILT